MTYRTAGDRLVAAPPAAPRRRSAGRVAWLAAWALVAACGESADAVDPAAHTKADISGGDGTLGGVDAGGGGTVARQGAIAIGALWPDRGPVGGGAIVLVHGAGFGEGAKVLFGDAEAEVIDRKDAIRLVVRTPAGGEGAADVTVRNADGGEARATGAYTYLTPTGPAPTLLAMAPAKGPKGGGTIAKVSGSGFVAKATFLLGWEPVAATGIASASEAQVRTAPLPLGSHPLAVILPDGQSALLPAAFAAVDGDDLGPPPALSAVLPTAGAVAGGVEVQVSGAGIAEGATLALGNAIVASWQRIDANSGRFVAPPAPPGAYDLVLTNPDGQSAVLPKAFAYFVPPPVIHAVAPSSGPVAGGGEVAIVGEGFAAGASASIGDKPCADAVLAADGGKITCKVAAAASAGPAAVRVVNPDGLSAKLPAAYSYLDPLPPPALTAVVPAQGPVQGGIVVVIQGKHLRPNSEVSFGAAKADTVSAAGSDSVAVVLPKGSAGTVDVTVTTPGELDAVLAGAFTYKDSSGPAIVAPAVAKVTPPQGPLAGGAWVLVQGAQLPVDAKVRFGAKAATAVVFLSPTQLAARVPAADAAGPVDVTVEDPATLASGKLAKGFAYLDAAGFSAPPPTLTAIKPALGPSIGGTLARLDGAAFGQGALVFFAGRPSPQAQVIGPTVLTAWTPPGKPGAAEVMVVQPDGQFASLDAGFVYTTDSHAGLAVASAKPAQGSAAGGTTVAVGGKGFGPGIMAFLDGAPVAALLQSPGELALQTPAHAPGVVAIAVTTADGRTAALADAFQFVLEAPYVASVAPGWGVPAGGSKVTIVGLGFHPAAVVTFAGGKATVVSASATALTVLTPPAAGGAEGKVDVSVTNPDFLTHTLAGGFAYAKVEPGMQVQLAAVLPPVAPVAGGSPHTLHGSGFGAGTSVIVGSALASDVVVIDSTSLTFLAPAGAKGPAEVRVVTPGAGEAKRAAALFYFDPASAAPFPTLAAIWPGVGPTSGGTVAVLATTPALADSVVLVDGVAAKLLGADGVGTLVVQMPPHVAGKADIAVVRPDGKAAVLHGGFAYWTPAADLVWPLLQGAEPTAGTTAGGSKITLTGKGFVAGTVGFVGGLPLGASTPVGGTALTGLTAPHDAGLVDAAITRPDGLSAVAKGAFSYVQPAPAPELAFPATGPVEGGTTVIVSGAGFAKGVSVHFGGTPAAKITWIAPHLLSCVAPVAAKAGPVALVLQNPDGQSGTLDKAFVYTDATGAAPKPVAAKILPDRGPWQGGTVGVLWGSHFQPGAKVLIGGVPATTHVVAAYNGSAYATFTTPKGVMGPVDVVLVNPDGQGATLAAGFQYVAAQAPPPQLLGVTPAAGPETGGTAVILTGGGLTGGGVGMVGYRPLASWSVLNSAIATGTTLPGQAGALDVTVTNGDGQSAKLVAAFTMVGAPLIDGFEPAIGPTAGGTLVTIAGKNFASGAEVRFGGQKAKQIQVLSPYVIKAVAPPSPPGPAQLSVSNPDGQGHTAAKPYLYALPPKITSIFPAMGSAKGGTPVIVRGEAFLPGAKVAFGATPAAAVTYINATTLHAIAPVGAVGAPAALLVDNPDGQSALAAKAWLWLDPAKMAPPPELAKITPAKGPQSGGTVGLAEGIGFLKGAWLLFGVFPAAAVDVLHGGQATFVTMAMEATGSVDVTLLAADGNFVVSKGAFEVVPDAKLGAKPAIAAVSPAKGPTKGGALVSIGGADLEDAAVVFFGKLPSPKATIAQGAIVATTPAHPEAVVEVVVTDAEGWSTHAPAAYAFVAPPALTSIDPAAGPAAGGTAVELKGKGFVVGKGNDGTRLMFCESFAQSADCVDAAKGSVEVKDATTLVATTPAHSSGLKDVVVINPDGQAVALPAAFLFRPPPKVVAITPPEGTTLGGTEVTISGSGFQKGAVVRFGGDPAPLVTVVDATKLVVLTPKGSAGPTTVTVENPDLGKHVVGGGFLYIAPPAITNVFPGLGPESGDSKVTIQGSGFVAGVKGSRVFFGSIEVPEDKRKVESAGIITVQTPPGKGPVAVKVQNPDGQVAILAGGFVYIPVVPAPKVSSALPAFAPTSGGVQVSVYGEQFLTGAVVSFGNDAIGYTKATENAVLNGGTLVVCKAPAHLPGKVNVKVTNSDGQFGVAEAAFEFLAPLALPALAISGLVPDRGPVEGGYDVALYGQGFVAGVEVFFGSATTQSWVKASAVVRLGPTLLRVVAPPAAKEGQVDVRVVNPAVGGKADEVVAKTAFTYGAGAVLVPMAHRLPIDASTGDLRVLTFDVNGDGLLDAFVHRADGADDLYLQVKDEAGEPGLFVLAKGALPTYHSYCDGSRTAPVAADLDGDSDIDVAFVGQGYYLCLLRNKGDGTFGSEQLGNHSLNYVRELIAAELTCDGHMDLLAVVNGENFVLVNNAKGGFVKNTTLLPKHNEPSMHAAAGDVDQDGDNDLVVSNDSAVQNRLYYNSCNNVPKGQPGSFQDANYGSGKNFPVSGFNTRGVVLRDLDGDGWLDVFLACYGQTDRIYLNKGGNFLPDDGKRFPQSVPHMQSGHAAAADVDGDGDIDLVVNHYRGNSRWWPAVYLNEKAQSGQTKFTDASPANLPAWRGEDSTHWALDDLTGDGLPDLWIVKTHHQDWLLVNHGFAENKAAIDANRVPKGSFANNTMRGIPANVQETSAAAAGDIDGDGDIDIVFGNYGAAPVGVWINDGAGNFFEEGPARVPKIDCGVAQLRLLDLNKDGDLDMMIACNYDGGGGSIGAVAAAAGSGGLRQLVNDGNGNFVDVSSVNLPWHKTNHRFYGMSFGDIDGDGDMDGVVGGYYYDPLELLIHGGDPFNNGGAYFFVKGGYLPAMPDDYRHRTGFVLADLNNDKLADLYLGRESAQNMLFHNSGKGVMKDVTTSHLPSLADKTRGVAAADVDGDGDMDLLVANDGPMRLQIAELDYKLADVTVSHMPSSAGGDVQDAAFVDLDGDGMLDIVSARWGQRNQLIGGVGDAHFKDWTTAMPLDADPSRVVVVADFDGDGRADLFFGNRDVNRIYLNKTPKKGK